MPMKRQLLRHGFLFLFVALWLGLATAAFSHPEKWLAGHVTALLTGLVLVAIGLAWTELTLTARQRAVAFWCGLISAYTGLVANIFTALVDLPGPASNPGVNPTGVPAAVFFALLAILIPTILTSFGLVLYGTRGAKE
jgi:hypothetical protein